MKIALIVLYGIENIGIRSISAVLTAAGFETKLFFFKKWRNNNIHSPSEREADLLLRGIEDFGPDIVGIGFGSAYFGIAVDLTARIRTRSKALIVWGGIHATVCPEDCIKHADVVCLGEGEFPLLEFAKAVDAGLPYRNIESLWVRECGAIIRNPVKSLLQNLDSLPYPDYGPKGKFYIEDNRMVCVEPMLFMREFRVCASRGCPFNCSYCYNSTLRRIYEGKGRYFRQHSVAYIIGFLSYALKHLNIKRVKFDDDTFAFDPAWVLEFCREYKKSIGLPFDLLIHPSLLEEGLLLCLKEAGLVKVQTGIESASDVQSEKIFKRAANNARLIEFSKFFSRLKIPVVYDIIMDDPMATLQDKQKMIGLLLELSRPFDLFLYSLTFFPKTGITEDFLSKGIITPEDVEDKSRKSFRQFRVSSDYSRPAEDRFFISLISLSSKSFIPRFLIRRISQSRVLRARPLALEIFSQSVNMIKLCVIAWKMVLDGEMTFMKFREYAHPRKLIIQ